MLAPVRAARLADLSARCACSRSAAAPAATCSSCCASASRRAPRRHRAAARAPCAGACSAARRRGADRRRCRAVERARRAARTSCCSPPCSRRCSTTPFQQRLARRRCGAGCGPGGGVLWYDFTVDNPRNPDVRGVPVARIRELFPEARVQHQRVTLAPPLARAVCALASGAVPGVQCPAAAAHARAGLDRKAA